MSRQLAVSSAFSIFALAALALFAPHLGTENEAGATIEIAAPSVPALPALYTLAD